MFGSEILEIIIGLIFIYLLYSLLASVIQEIIATNFAFRAKILEKAVTRMLDDGDEQGGFHRALYDRVAGFLRLFWRKKKKKNSSADLFFEHPLTKYLGEDRWHSKPSYIEAKDFSKVLIDLLKSEPGNPGEDFRKKIEEALETGELKWTYGGKVHRTKINEATLSYIKSIWAEAQGDLEKFRILIESWFDETMLRASGWYKRYTQVILFAIGLCMAIVFNVDTLLIVHKLERDPKLREQLVQSAENYVKAHPDLVKEIEEEKKAGEQLINTADYDSLKRIGAKKQLDSVAKVRYAEIRERRKRLQSKADSILQNDIAKTNNLLGIDRSNPDYVKQPWWRSLLGWLITAIAISMGAPFWFDLLNKLMKLRGAMAKKNEEKATEEETKKGKIVRKG